MEPQSATTPIYYLSSTQPARSALPAIPWPVMTERQNNILKVIQSKLDVSLRVKNWKRVQSKLIEQYPDVTLVECQRVWNIVKPRFKLKQLEQQKAAAAAPTFPAPERPTPTITLEKRKRTLSVPASASAKRPRRAISPHSAMQVYIPSPPGTPMQTFSINRYGQRTTKKHYLLMPTHKQQQEEVKKLWDSCFGEAPTATLPPSEPRKERAISPASATTPAPLSPLEKEITDIEDLEDLAFLDDPALVGLIEGLEQLEEE